MSYTMELLQAGGFEIKYHGKVAGDIRAVNSADQSAWPEMRVILDRVQSGTCRPDDWTAPLAKNYQDIGEIKKRRGRRLYRLYVHASRQTPNRLVVLHFGWKPPGNQGLDIQNQHIDEACARLLELFGPPKQQ
ncbi:Uncharacterised protein [Mycobacteroides abscessus subsp. abscessus]|nr:Uncharacterised protein [Mycobacteroides abscessus subsp. abscessus]SHY60954.1 Uncharacterised protein [Mycobacteroides abscessus subsp. abscessus]SIK85124.1 Uncharacterised protein [Mycobacteroides abscessus subsp. abscessus]SLC91112.1 Uncharacterised protein [Mycobacteroides abscessus subsp. abscessus]